MTFEILNRDLMARIGYLETKSGTIETPLLLPVINPNLKPITPKVLETKFNCNAIITNAYIINQNFKRIVTDTGLHNFLNFNGSIMTDSGAYQLLIYKGIETTPKEIVQFQEQIDTDIATILDVPTGWNVPKEYAYYTVNETIRRGKELEHLKTRDDIAWVGPVQGGQYLDLIEQSAIEMGKLPFNIYALGSPTPIMEQYRFDLLVDMIIAAKINLPPDRPMHLFGAGHPFMFSLAIALGCDLFDSAAYALFARQDRYMTVSGTIPLSIIEYFPCSCPICEKNDPSNIKLLPKQERQKLIAEHNLYVSFCELKKIKQAICEGRLWEHMEMRAHSHPSLLQALKKLGKYRHILEKQSPVSKNRGIFFFSHLGLSRPEVVRYRKRLFDNFVKPLNFKILLLLPQTQTKPFHNSKEHEAIWNELHTKLNSDIAMIHFCTYAAPFGVIPSQLDEIYPISQNEITFPLDFETKSDIAKQLKKFIQKNDYEHIVILQDSNLWNGEIITSFKQACRKKNIPSTIILSKDPWAKKTIQDLTSKLTEIIFSLKN